ncbi:MAG: hypothetical protein ACRC1M_07225 [Methanobacteriaceae archaeon]
MKKILLISILMLSACATKEKYNFDFSNETCEEINTKIKLIQDNNLNNKFSDIALQVTLPILGYYWYENDYEEKLLELQTQKKVKKC